MFGKKQQEPVHSSTPAEASKERRRLDICQSCHHRGGSYVGSKWVKCEACDGTGQQWVWVSS